jgi:hypothetical protein
LADHARKFDVDFGLCRTTTGREDQEQTKLVELSIVRHLSVFRHGCVDTVFPFRPASRVTTPQLARSFRHFCEVYSPSCGLARDSL